MVARRFARWQAITSGIRDADLVSRVVSLARRLSEQSLMAFGMLADAVIL